jgi:hypothetical protein
VAFGFTAYVEIFLTLTAAPSTQTACHHKPFRIHASALKQRSEHIPALAALHLRSLTTLALSRRCRSNEVVRLVIYQLQLFCLGKTTISNLFCLGKTTISN